jgi:hypothetical protein
MIIYIDLYWYLYLIVVNNKDDNNKTLKSIIKNFVMGISYYSEC